MVAALAWWTTGSNGERRPGVRAALEQAALVRAGDVSPLELVELYLERIERLDPQLNAYVTVDDALASRARRRPVHGRADPDQGPERDRRAAHDVLVPRVRRLRAEDRCRRRAADPRRRLRDHRQDEHAGVRLDRDDGVGAERRLPQPVGHLAHAGRLERRRGGRGRGGLAPVAHGSDGGGSIRIPASCCNLFGLKPSRGRVSPAPYGSGSLGLGTSGPIARTVRDAAALLDVMSGYEPGDFYVAPTPERPFLAEAGEDPGRLRIAVTTEPPVDVPVDPVCVPPRTQRPRC